MEFANNNLQTPKRTPNNKNKYKDRPNKASHPKLPVLLDNLCSRFIINCPEVGDQLSEPVRICFQIEQAHWFYEDFYREEDKTLPAFHLKEFAKLIFNHCSLLKSHKDNTEEILNKFNHYKTRVPVYGAVLLNPTMDKCLLVKGYSSRSSWGFPKGKINKDEAEIDCAIREVYEEIGHDLTGTIKEEDHIQFILKEQLIKLYIVPNISEETKFETRTRKEISKIEWAIINGLPTSYQSAKELGSENFFMVIPFVHKLKQWIKQKRETNGKRKSPQKKNSTLKHLLFLLTNPPMIVITQLQLIHFLKIFMMTVQHKRKIKVQVLAIIAISLAIPTMVLAPIAVFSRINQL